MATLSAAELALPIGPDVEELRLVGGNAGDTFAVAPSSTTAVFVDGRQPTSGSPGDTLDLQAPAGSRPRLDPGAVGAGVFVFDGGLRPVSFSGIETLLGVDTTPPFVDQFFFAFQDRQEIVATFSEGRLGQRRPRHDHRDRRRHRPSRAAVRRSSPTSPAAPA